MVSRPQSSNRQTAAIPPLTLGQSGGGALGSGDIVNLFQGSLSFPLEILTLPGRNGLECKVNLLYQSHVQDSVEQWNLDFPTDTVGVGWSLPYERIEISPKANGSRLDDEYYLISQGQTNRLIAIPTQWTIGQISEAAFQQLIQNPDAATRREWQRFNRKLSNRLRLQQQSDQSYLLYDDGMERSYQLRAEAAGTYTVTTAGQSFELERFQYWQISYYPDYEQWEIIKEDGTCYRYGGRDIAQTANTLQYGIKWGNWIGNTPNTSGEQYVRAWNLAKVENVYGNSYTVNYQIVTQPVGAAGDHYTTECHIENITNDFGWSLQYQYLPKTYDTTSLDAPKEYLDPHQDPASYTFVSNAYQRQYATVYLKQITLLNAQGEPVTWVNFDYHDLTNLTQNDGNLLAYGATYKRYLKSITQSYQAGETKPGLEFQYDFTIADGTQNCGALTQILSPAGAIVTIYYRQIEVGADEVNAPGDRNQTIGHPFDPAKAYEPKFWYGDDYVVSLWFNDDDDILVLNVFTWQGQWTVSSQDWFEFDNIGSIDLEQLQVVTSGNTFVLSTPNERNDSQDIYLFNRRHLCKATWDIHKISQAFAVYSYDKINDIASGDNFFIVNGEDTNGDDVVDRYAWNWSTQTWEIDHLADESQLCQTVDSSNRYYTTAYGNYYIIFCYTPSEESKFSLFYLSQTHVDENAQLNWQLGGTYVTDAIRIPSTDGFSYFNFAPSDSFAAFAYITHYTGNVSFNYKLQILTWDDQFSNLALAAIDNWPSQEFTSVPTTLIKSLGPEVASNTLVASGRMFTILRVQPGVILMRGFILMVLLPIQQLNIIGMPIQRTAL